MRNTIIKNGWNTTEWGLSFLRASSFPVDASSVFDSEEEFLNYLAGAYSDKPYLGLLVTVKKEDTDTSDGASNNENYTTYLINSSTTKEDKSVTWLAVVLNGKTLDEVQEMLKDLKELIATELEGLLDKINGGATADFDTLKKLQDYLLLLEVKVNLGIANLQEELNRTQTGVGLDQSGNFSPDQETNYLKNATSVMSALRILDEKLKPVVELKEQLFSITDLKATPNIAYKGQPVDIVLSWDYVGIMGDDTPDSLYINDEKINSSLRTYTFNGVSDTTTYTVKAIRGKKTAIESVTIPFLEVALFGADSSELDNTDTLTIYLGKPAKVDCTGGKYLYFAERADSDTTPTLNGLVLDDFTSKAITHSGLDYRLYKSNNKYNGTVTFNII